MAFSGCSHDSHGPAGEFQAYRSFQTHELDVLLRLSGQDDRIKRGHLDVWSVVAAWRAELRYNAIGTTRQAEAEGMVEAAEQLLAVL